MSQIIVRMVTGFTIGLCTGKKVETQLRSTDTTQKNSFEIDSPSFLITTTRALRHFIVIFAFGDLQLEP